MMLRSLPGLACAVLLACSVDGGEEATFGVPTGAGSSPGSSPGSADDGTGEDSGSGTGAGSSSTAGSDDAADGSTGNPLGDSSGSPTTTDMPGDESSSGGMPPGMGGQPADGMYSDCMDARNDCLPLTNLCFVINGNDGFCSNTMCANPAADCDPAPGGTATPVCYPLDDQSFCALSCEGGLTCPTGMVCYPNLDSGGALCA